MIRGVVLCAFVFCAAVCAENAADSEAAAITVYRNPEFFKRVNQKREREELEPAEEDEDNADVYRSSEDFYDFDDDYRYPGEPKKPNPPAAPDFTAYYDESPEFHPQPRDPSPSPYTNEQQEEEQSEEHDGNELNEEEEEPVQEEYDEPPTTDKYHVPMEKDLEMRVPETTYEQSKEYYNPVFDEGMKSYSYPQSYEELDYYSYPYEEEKPVKYTDNKKGTREYLRDHSPEEVEEPRSGNLRAGSKHFFKAVSKIGFKTLHPTLFYVHHMPKKIKYKYLRKPKKIISKWRFAREVPDDSAYQLSSDYDSDFELF